MTHEWKRAWDQADTPEKRRELIDQVRSKRIEAQKKLADDLREHKRVVESKTCVNCGVRVNSNKRRLCPPCRRKWK